MIRLALQQLLGTRLVLLKPLLPLAALRKLAVTRGGTLALAALLDWALAEPPSAVHPVVWMGRLLAAAEPALLRGPSSRQLVVGALVAAGGAGGWFVVGRALDQFLVRSALFLPLRAWLLKCCFAWRALDEAAARVEGLLREGRLAAAQTAVQSLVSRETAALDAEQVAAAAIESVAENLGDSLVGPVLAYAVGGLGGAFAYRWVNTADAMVGYRGRFEWGGKAAARLDDLANFVPARLAAALLLLCGGDRRSGLDALRRDRGQTASPNAGWPMATMAGLLGRSLEKPGAYRLNASAPAPGPSDILAARRIVARAWLLLAAVGSTLLLLRRR
ncbi:MAG: adenosylcobinamide-phosphate synthase CbiB [Chloroflexota bacterium]|nr:adenosylcobinamide-phosphate synthase CbiB [Dehalococcoidia bacterium]MDW8255032.1 adenosylcobinamide-phosphate synthase CbiB [Chloroflexota bacterium]